MTAPTAPTEPVRCTSGRAMRGLGAGLALTAMLLPIGHPGSAFGQSESVRLHAAGSLRAALTHLARDFTAAYGVPVDLVFGASGLLRERLEGGEPSDVFASANMEHPQALARSGKPANRKERRL